jgi:hypothetical protein
MVNRTHLGIGRIAAQRSQHLLQLREVRHTLCGLLEERVHGGGLLLLWDGVALAGVQAGQQVVQSLLLLRLVVRWRVRQLHISRQR